MTGNVNRRLRRDSDLSADLVETKKGRKEIAAPGCDSVRLIYSHRLRRSDGTSETPTVPNKTAAGAGTAGGTGTQE